MAYKVIATYIPTGEQSIYGPYPPADTGDLDVNRLIDSNHASFGQGFLSGAQCQRIGEESYDPTQMAYQLAVVADEAPETSLLGKVEAFASASVTHPDGSTD